jgi:DNA-binding PadR family transcriptional regulator
MPFRSSDALLPLTPISFEILLALLEGDRHGYAILQSVEARLGGVLPMRTGTIYRALARLLDEGLIGRATESSRRPGASRPAAAEDERRRHYRITPLGRKIAKAEAERLADQVNAARAHRLLPESRK